MEVAPGVHQIRFTSPNNPKFQVFAYLIVGDGDCGLVDAGWGAPQSYDALKEQFAEAGVAPSDVKTIVMTHLHPDHFGLAGKVKQESGARVVFHELEKPFVETRYRSYSKLLDLMADWLLSYGVPDNEVAELQTASVGARRFVLEVDADTVVVGGEIVKMGGRDWEVIWTPGHTRGHICLYNRAGRVIITGDHVLPGITPNISLHPESSDDPLGDFFASLRKIVDLPVEVVLPAHEHTFTGLSRRIRAIEDHHEQRLEAMLGTLTDEPKTGYQVASEIQWTIGTFKNFDVLARRSALMETLAHLEYLRRQGRLEKIIGEGVFRYRRR